MSALDIAGVVVHHRSRATLEATIDRLITEGLEPGKLLIVDNSEDQEQVESLKETLPPGVNIIFTPNSGYGAAVNEGVEWHKRNTPPTASLLVSTHEALPEPGSLKKLAAALEAHEKAALVGPALVTGENSDVVWSLGGYFTGMLGLPRHFGHKSPREQLGSATSGPVEWLDGAFLLFRRTVLEAHPIDEDFFLYMEETDHQQSIRREGWEVRLEPAAVVWQSSGGTPAFYLARNIQLFQAKNGSRLQKLVSAPYLVATAVLRDAVRGRGVSNWKPLLAGWKAGWQLQARRPKNPVTVLVNPLGGALAHYTEALARTLKASGTDVRLFAINEPSVSGQSRWRWLSDYLRLLAKTRAIGRLPHNQTLVVWPVLGFFDLVLVRLLCGARASVVYHDPKPLVRAAGSDPLSARLVFRLPNLPHVVVHSAAAAKAMKSLGFTSTMHLLAHPMLPPAVLDTEDDGRAPVRRPVVRVLGQFKRDRDLGALEALARELKSEVDLEIVGRGWPQLDGWNVDSRFVSEQELDELVKSSDAIVIPYLRFYQSGIAIRALESNTPVVGRAATSLADLYGQESRLLIREDPQTGLVEARAWAEAVRYAVTDAREETSRAALAYHSVAVSEWKSWTGASAPVNERSPLASYTLLALGPASPRADAEWLSHPLVKATCQYHQAAITGKRYGSRVLGIGVDSLILAVRTLSPSVRGPYLATNPWIGAALRLTGRKNFVVTGIYAEPSSRSWKVLRRLIGDAPVITMSKSETGPWNADGGRAQAVLYGNSLGYPPRKASQNLHIFVGGTSDRDPQVIRALEDEVLASSTPVQLTLATGEPAGEIRRGENVVKRPGYVSQQEFGELLSTASVAFLPLASGTRAAGHMVLVGALESGIPVSVTPNEGMSEYVIGPAVALCDPAQAILPQLRDLAEASRSKQDEIRAFWADAFSLKSYIDRVGEVLDAPRN